MASWLDSSLCQSVRTTSLLFIHLIPDPGRGPEQGTSRTRPVRITPSRPGRALDEATSTRRSSRIDNSKGPPPHPGRTEEPGTAAALSRHCKRCHGGGSDPGGGRGRARSPWNRRVRDGAGYRTALLARQSRPWAGGLPVVRTHLVGSGVPDEGQKGGDADHRALGTRAASRPRPCRAPGVRPAAAVPGGVFRLPG